jgi:hypothetical protein
LGGGGEPFFIFFFKKNAKNIKTIKTKKKKQHRHATPVEQSHPLRIPASRVCPLFEQPFRALEVPLRDGPVQRRAAPKVERVKVRAPRVLLEVRLVAVVRRAVQVRQPRVLLGVQRGLAVLCAHRWRGREVNQVSFLRGWQQGMAIGGFYGSGSSVSSVSSETVVIIYMGSRDSGCMGSCGCVVVGGLWQCRMGRLVKQTGIKRAPIELYFVCNGNME